MAATDMYVTTTGAGTKSGLGWANAFSLTEFETDVETLTEAGDRYFFKEGTYTLASDISTARVGAYLPIELIGVVTATTAEPPTSSDWATGTNRPLFACTTYAFTFSNYYQLRNLRITTASANGVKISSYGALINCKAENSSGTANYEAMTVGIGSRVTDCEAISTNGIGVYANAYSRLIGCYIHDCGVYGVQTNGGVVFHHTILDTCATGALVNDGDYLSNCTVYNCSTAGLYTSILKHYATFLNNAIDSCTVGFKSNNSGVVLSAFLFDYNNWSNNTKDMSWNNGTTEDNSGKGPNATANAPSFTNAAAGNFSLDSASALLDAGFSIDLGVS